MHHEPIDSRIEIGHVHLKVANVDRALEFYCGVLGMQVTHRLGNQVAFVSAGGYHQHIGLNAWESMGAASALRSHAGLHHLAIRYPDRRSLADAVRRVLGARIALEGANDHGFCEAIYLRDFDDNGVELYRDRPVAEWPRNEDGSLRMPTEPLDVQGLLAELAPVPLITA